MRIEEYLASFDSHILRFIETYGLIVHPVRHVPPVPPHDGTITWHLRPDDGLAANYTVYIDGSAFFTQYGPTIARFAFAIIAFDSEQRLVAAKVIKRFILHAKKTGFVVEHDFIMATYLADRVIVFEGQASVDTLANSPQPLLSGMNKFLGQLGITFRRDPNNFRPRINKLDSIKDREQKASGNYFFLGD